MSESAVKVGHLSKMARKKCEAKTRYKETRMAKIKVSSLASFEATTQQRSFAFWGGMVLLAGLIIFTPVLSEASFFYHAARRGAARGILSKGINPGKFRGSARFWKKFYASKRPSTAIAEKGSRSSVLRFRTSRQLERRALDLRNPTRSRLHSLLRGQDLRGTVKHRVIGPKLGHKLGRLAEKRKQAILYRSAKTGKTNIAIPGSSLKKHPRFLRPEKIVR